MRAPWEQSESRATAWPPKVSFYRTCTGSGDSTATLTMLDLSLSLWKVMANPSILGGCNNVLDMVPPKYHLECEITTANLVGLKWSVTPPVQNCVGCEFGRSLLAELPKPGLSDLLNSGTEDWSGNWSSWHALCLLKWWPIQDHIWLKLHQLVLPLRLQWESSNVSWCEDWVLPGRKPVLLTAKKFVGITAWPRGKKCYRIGYLYFSFYLFCSNLLVFYLVT